MVTLAILIISLLTKFPWPSHYSLGSYVIASP